MPQETNRLIGAVASRSSQNIPKEMLVISPHSDDACYSLACMLRTVARSLEARLEIITCFSISDFEANPHNRSIDAISRIRKSEDREFQKFIGGNCEMQWLDLLDAPLRGYNLSDICRGNSFTKEDERLVEILSKAVGRKITQDSTVYLPLAIGNHVDHRIALSSAIRLIEYGGLSQEQVVYYEDLPYAGQLNFVDIEQRVEDVGRLAFTPLRPVIFHCATDPGALVRAVKIYKSQYVAAHFRAIDLHIKSLDGNVRLWTGRPVEDDSSFHPRD